eukprot:5195515-Prymnesium_polylepis.2
MVSSFSRFSSRSDCAEIRGSLNGISSPFCKKTIIHAASLLYAMEVVAARALARVCAVQRAGCVSPVTAHTGPPTATPSCEIRRTRCAPT